MPGETGGVTGGGIPAAPPAFWPSCTGRARISQIQSERGVTLASPAIQPDFTRWDHGCGLEDRNSLVLSEGE